MKFRQGPWLIIDLGDKAVTASVVDATEVVKPCIQGRGETASRFFSSEIFLQGGEYTGATDERFVRLLAAMARLDKNVWPSFEILGWLKPVDASPERDAALPDPLGMASRFAWAGEDIDKAERLGVLIHLFVLSPVEEAARLLTGGRDFSGAVLIMAPNSDRLAQKVVRKAMSRLGFEHVVLLERDHALALCAHYSRGALEANCFSIEAEGLRLTRVSLSLAESGLVCRTETGVLLKDAGWQGFADSVAEAVGQAAGVHSDPVIVERALLGLICAVGSAKLPPPLDSRLSFNLLEGALADAWQSAFRKRLSAHLANLDHGVLTGADGPAVGWGLPFALDGMTRLLGQCVFAEPQGRFAGETPFSDRAIAGVAALFGRVLKGDGFTARLSSGQGLHLWSGGAFCVELVSGQALRMERGESRKYFQTLRLESGATDAGNEFSARIQYGFGNELEAGATVGAWAAKIPQDALDCGLPLEIEVQISRDQDSGQLAGVVVFSIGSVRGEALVQLPENEVLIGPVVDM